MQLKDHVYKTCVHLCKFIIPIAVVALAVSLSWCQNGKTMMSARKKELGDWRENESNKEPKCSHYPLKSTARLMSTREQWLAKQRMAVSRNNHILAFGEVFETLLTFWKALPSFLHFGTLVVAHGWLHSPRLLTVMHTCRLLVQKSLWCTWGIHCKYVYTPSMIHVTANLKYRSLEPSI